MTVQAAAALRAIDATAASAPASITGAAGIGSAAATGSPAGADFASVLADIASSGLQTVRAGEAAALSGLQGKASVQQVVEAVMSAEQTLQAAIAIRDKVVAAYQEISRMAI
jgi:flagellar hook-basal body complex protein FliE